MLLLQRPIPDETFYESRPTIKAVNGSRSGELSLSVNVIMYLSQLHVIFAYGMHLIRTDNWSKQAHHAVCPNECPRREHGGHQGRAPRGFETTQFCICPHGVHVKEAFVWRWALCHWFISYCSYFQTYVIWSQVLGALSIVTHITRSITSDFLGYTQITMHLITLFTTMEE
jgi:hypothetical protein